MPDQNASESQQFDELLGAADRLSDDFYSSMEVTYQNRFPESTVIRIVVGTEPPWV